MLNICNNRYKYKQKENLLKREQSPLSENMLPSLKKPIQQYQASQIKLYNPPKQLISIDNHENQRKSSQYSNMMASSRTNNKLKAMSSGFKKGQASQKDGAILMGKKQSKASNYNYQNYPPNNASVKQNSLTKDQSYGYQYGSMPNKSMANVMSAGKRDLNAEIKLIQKKIRYHKKKIQEQKKRKQEEQKQKDDPFNQDFQRIIEKEMELQGIPLQENKGFDYLTNPGKANQQEHQQQQIEQQIQQPQPIIIAQPKKFDMMQNVQKLERHYQNNLKKKFERRQMFPHYPCKRKTPKLYITQKTNALQKFGKKPPKQEHMFRIMTRQCTPQQIYPTIPNFAVVKDSLSRNVMAYLGDYKPFIEKTKQVVQDSEQQNEPNEPLQNRERLEGGQLVRIQQNLSTSQNKQPANIELNA